MATTALQKFLNQLSKNRNVQNVVNEFHKVSTDLKKRGQELNARLSKGSEQTMKQAHDRYHEVLGKVQKTQKQLDREVEHAVERIRVSAEHLGKNLESYRKQAMKQRDQLAKMMRTSATKTKKTTRASTKRAGTAAKKKTSRKSK